MSWKQSLNVMSMGLANVGEKMVHVGRDAAQIKNVRGAVRIAAQFPVKELAVMCGRAGMAGAVVDGASGAFHGLRAMRRGEVDGRQVAIHAGAEAGCGFVTSTAGTAGTLAAYMITGTMGPLAIAAGMGASVGSRYVYRMVVGETLPQKPDDGEEDEGKKRDEDAFDHIGPKPQI